MTDNIFEIETTVLVHFACAPRESGVLLTDFAAAWFYLPILANYLQRQHHRRGIRGGNSETILYGQRCETRLSRERFFFFAIRSSDDFKKQLSQEP